MGVSKNNGTPKSSILIGVFIINHPFWGTPIFGNIHVAFLKLQLFLDDHALSTSPTSFYQPQETMKRELRNRIGRTCRVLQTNAK